MVNIPSNLQGVWNEVAKDGKIDKSDIQKLLKEAAPSLSKDGKDIDVVKNELDVNEEAFFDNFESVIKNNAVVDVKNGTAPGTFEFVDQIKFPKPNKDNASSTQTKDVSGANQYYTPVTLGDNKVETPSEKPPVTTEQKVETGNTQVTTGVNPQDEKDLANLKNLKKTLTEKLSTPEIKEQITSIDKKIADLEAKIAKAKTPESEVKPAPTPDKKEEVKTEPKQTTSDVKKDIETLTNLHRLKDQILKNPNDPELQKQLATVDQKISALEPKVKQAFINDVKNLSSRLSSPDFAKERDAVKANFDLLPSNLKNDPDIKASMDSVSSITSKQVVFAKINDVISLTVNQALRTGDMSKFTIAKNEVQRIVDQNPELANDPEIQKIKAILSGAAPTERSANNYVYRAIDTIKTTQTLLDKPNWTKADYAKAQELLVAKNDPTDKSESAQKFFVEGDFRTKLENKAKGYIDNKEREKNLNKNTAIKGIEDVGGKGFFNATNKDGVIAMFQSLASKNELEETIKRMKHEDQIRIMKILAETGDKFNLSISKKIYEIASSSSNIDDEIKPKLRDKIKESDSKDLNKYPINQDNFYKGLQYSMYSEKDAAMTMIRDIIGGTVPSSILSKFNSEEIGIMTDLISKHGHFEEKEEFLSLISGNYAKGDSTSIEYMDKKEKAQVIKGLLDNTHIDETKLDDLISKAGKKAVFDVVKNNELTNKQLVILAKHTNGDEMADEPEIASKMLLAMIREYNRDQTSVSLNDLNKFIDEIDKDWNEDDDVMKLVLRQLGDGPESEYARFQKLAKSTLDKMIKIAD